jgi:hypothetical protein
VIDGINRRRIFVPKFPSIRWRCNGRASPTVSSSRSGAVSHSPRHSFVSQMTHGPTPWPQVSDATCWPLELLRLHLSVPVSRSGM